MKEVRIAREKLWEKLKENRENHRNVFLKAQVGYRAAVIEELEKMLSDARDGKRIPRAVGLRAPVDQTREYDRVIAMLEMSVDEFITLTQAEFVQYVRDEWAWAENVGVLNTTYSTGGKLYDGNQG